ncbi:NAD(P)/FAD-dependent oxidoreductase [Pontibacter korlensis]|uniref:FAD-dependent oxidoreductase n=1 Tax=Pontibacter korlensis TaxID=400092 RepID=UPI000A078706
MSLGRALRKVLVIDNGKPCNRQTPHSHNFITQDGETPGAIALKAREQVQKYNSVHFFEGTAVTGRKSESGFEIEAQTGEIFSGSRLVFATGLRDIMPPIKGFAECWGISVLHCPYCHGYEVKQEKIGIIANGDVAFHYAQLISNWTADLILFTNGKSTLTEEQTRIVLKHNIQIIEKEIDSLEHKDGYVRQVVFKDNSVSPVKAIYSRPAFEQRSGIPKALGCELTEQGLLKVDNLQRTTVKGIYACGDTSSGRAVSVAVSTGTMAGAALNNHWREEEFS